MYGVAATGLYASGRLIPSMNVLNSASVSFVNRSRYPS